MTVIESPRPTEINEDRIKAGRRSRRTAEEISRDWLELWEREKSYLSPVVE